MIGVNCMVGTAYLFSVLVDDSILIFSFMMNIK
jgi:hypothetical protein